MTQTEEHLTGDGIQVQDDISITIRPAAAWMRNLAAVFLAACGFIGTIAASLSMFSPIYNRTKLILIAAAIFILYSVLSILPKKLRWLTLSVLRLEHLGSSGSGTCSSLAFNSSITTFTNRFMTRTCSITRWIPRWWNPPVPRSF